MNIAILVISFLLFLEHFISYWEDETNNFFTVIGLDIIVVLISFKVFGIVTWFIICGVGIGLFTITFIEEWKRFKIIKESNQEKDQGTTQLL